MARVIRSRLVADFPSIFSNNGHKRSMNLLASLHGQLSKAFLLATNKQKASLHYSIKRYVTRSHTTARVSTAISVKVFLPRTVAVSCTLRIKNCTTGKLK